jgi:pantoate--beta-alanine ligase
MLQPTPEARSVSALRKIVSGWRESGARIGLLPTKGALHAGHLALLTLLKQRTDKIVVSIFADPARFETAAAFKAFPRSEERDLETLRQFGVDLAFLPSVEEMYPEGYAAEPPLHGADPLHPHVWSNIPASTSTLLLRCAPDAAAFGEKDYPQLLAVKRWAKALDFPIDIVSGPVCREPDGLAISSRAVHLSPAQRVIAGKLNVILRNAGKRALNGAAPDLAEAEAADALRVAGFDSVDYVTIADAETLEPFGQQRLNRPGRILGAARIGETRLIDNFPIVP